LLFEKKKIEHSYPHCWRCDTPLLNYATSSWFVAVERIKEDLLKNAEPIYWYPNHIKYGRWGRWLEGARDWSISRNRFWANTIPVFRCTGAPEDGSRTHTDTLSGSRTHAEVTQMNAEGCGNEVVVGSIAELEELSGQKVEDLHKDVVDEITWTCNKCGGVMKRVPDVLDTWFNSGSVPYATMHYPFENKEEFEKRNPADFIAEGQDQTRAWFYYQHVLATALFERNAFKNVITTGIVLAEDGKKMSKKLKNYPDPMYIVDNYGADAMRLYMLGSPVVRADNLAFSEKEVAEIARKVFGRLVNVYEFYALYKDDLQHKDNAESTRILDRWIVARLYQVHKQVTDALDEYALDKAVRPIDKFVDDLSTWYIRRSRDRFKGDDEQDKLRALQTTRYVLRKFAKLLAPLAPFHADWLWVRVKRDGDPESVHLSNWCSQKEVDDNLLVNMQKARELVTLALDARKDAGIKVRQPLAKLLVNKERFNLPDELLQVVADEINVKEVIKDVINKDIELDTNITEELKKEGLARELLRAVQKARKEAGLTPDELVSISISAPEEFENALEEYKDYIKQYASLKGFDFEQSDKIKIYINR